MAQRRTRSAAKLDQEHTPPHARRRSTRITPNRASSSAQPFSSQQPATDTNSARKGKRKQLPESSESPKNVKYVNTTRSSVLITGTSGSGSYDPSNLRSKCFRITGLPSSWTENDLFDILHAADPSLTHENYRPSLYPACYGTTQTALLNLDSSTERLQRQEHLIIQQSASKTEVLTLDCSFHNLTPLNVPRGKVAADVIAVTGLAGHAFSSWRSSETDQMWLKDFLPHDVENIRIMSYGYDSRLIGHGKAKNRLLDYKRGFLQDIENARSSTEKTRPIILIGHSLGGILILQALIEAKRNPSYKYLLDALHSIVFFGTPHQGMRTYDLEEMVEAESGRYETSKQNLLNQLREGSEFLENQMEELCYILEDYKPQIVSFYETVLTPTVKMSDTGGYGRDGEESEMVKRFSALLYIPNEQRVPVEKNHLNIVKFASAQDPTYRTVVGYLTTWVVSITSAANKVDKLRNSQEYICCMKSLNPPDYESIRDLLLHRRHENTCTWVLDDQRYRIWAKKDSHAVLWISGGPGCGKSVLSSYLTKEIIRGNQISMAYSFCDDKDERLRTAHSILINLLTQLLNQLPDLMVHFSAEREFTVNKEKTIWNFGMLWRVFERIMNDANIGRVCILIDALDECEEGSRTHLMDQLQHLLRGSTIVRHTKILITSRPHILVPSYFTDTIEMPLVAENLQHDITTFVETETQPLFDDNLREEVRQALIDGANGMFLWVSLILEDLKRSRTTMPRAIREKLKTLPRDLPGVYINILRKIQTEDQTTAESILQWVVWAARPLTLEELKIAIAIQPEHTSMASMVDDMHTDLRQVLRLVFGAMLRIEVDDTIHLVHQSAKDFLIHMSVTGGKDPSDDHQPAFCLASAKTNLRIASCCLTYLLFDDCEYGPVNHRSIEQNIQSQQKKLPFLKYAATHWPEHVRQTDYTSDEHKHLCGVFRKLAESPNKCDFAYAILSGPLKYKKTPPLEIVASLGLITFLEELLAHDADIDTEGSSAIRVAVQRGHVAMVRLLLDRGANIGCGALYDAVLRGNEAIVRLLLDRGADIDAQDCYCGALQVAAERGNEALVHLLLDRGANINAHGVKYGTALQAAALSSNEATVSLLLDRGADVNAPGGQNGNALRIAASGGKEAIVSLLLDRGADINPQDGEYGSALQVAAERGNEAIVSLLLDRGADVNVKGGIYGHALQAAARSGNETNISLLLDRGAEVNAQDGYYGSALRAAALHSSEAIVSLLLDRGADINAQGGKYGSALQAAIESGNEAVVRLLLDRSPEIYNNECSSSYYDSALQAAAVNRNEVVDGLLVERGATTNASG